MRPRSLWKSGERKLDWAEKTEQLRASREHAVTEPSRLTEIAGAARKAVEYALQTAIVAAGRRPHAWKDPAGLAGEAEAAGARLPAVKEGALARAANHYTGTRTRGTRHQAGKKPTRRSSWHEHWCPGRDRQA